MGRRIIYSERAKEELWLLVLRHRTVRRGKTHGMTRNLKPSVRSRCSFSSFFIPFPKILLYTFSSSTDTLSLSAERAKNFDFSLSLSLPFPATAAVVRWSPVPGAAPLRCRGETKASAGQGALAFSTKLPPDRNYSRNRRRLKGWATQKSRGSAPSSALLSRQNNVAVALCSAGLAEKGVKSVRRRRRRRSRENRPL